MISISTGERVSVCVRHYASHCAGTAAAAIRHQCAPAPVLPTLHCPKTFICRSLFQYQYTRRASVAVDGRGDRIRIQCAQFDCCCCRPLWPATQRSQTRTHRFNVHSSRRYVHVHSVALVGQQQQHALLLRSCAAAVRRYRITIIPMRIGC